MIALTVTLIYSYSLHLTNCTLSFCTFVKLKAHKMLKILAYCFVFFDIAQTFTFNRENFSQRQPVHYKTLRLLLPLELVRKLGHFTSPLSLI